MEGYLAISGHTVFWLFSFSVSWTKTLSLSPDHWRNTAYWLLGYLAISGHTVKLSRMRNPKDREIQNQKDPLKSPGWTVVTDWGIWRYQGTQCRTRRPSPSHNRAGSQIRPGAIFFERYIRKFKKYMYLCSQIQKNIQARYACLTENCRTWKRIKGKSLSSRTQWIHCEPKVMFL